MLRIVVLLANGKIFFVEPDNFYQHENGIYIKCKSWKIFFPISAVSSIITELIEGELNEYINYYKIGNFSEFYKGIKDRYER